MDDLLLFTPSKRSYIIELEDLLKALLKNGLKISPKEMSVLLDKFALLGKWDIYTEEESLH